MPDWYEEEIDRLRTLWDTRGDDGKPLSTAEISRRLGKSKNAVVGKAHRLCLEPRPSPILRSNPGCGHRRRPPRPRITLPDLSVPKHEIVVPPPPPEPPAPPPHKLPIMRCCWLIGEKPWVYCDDPTVPGRVYCLPHCKRAYVSPRAYHSPEKAA